MAASPTRPGMKLLSLRVQCLVQCNPALAVRQSARFSTRYSNPLKPDSALRSTQNASTSSVPTPDEPIVDPRKAEEKRRQYHLRRMRFSGMGLLATLATLNLILYNLDLDELEKAYGNKNGTGQQLDASDEANARFQGKRVHVIGAGEGKRIVAEGEGQQVELVETGTSTIPHFPKTIYLPASAAQAGGASEPPNSPSNPGNMNNEEQYTLLGLGIRTVMWIQVYVVGLYVRTQDIGALQEKLIHHINPIASTLVPGEKDDLRKKLLDPAESRVIWEKLLEVPGIKTAWRVSPTRNTDFGHLRDGFVTGIHKRVQEAKQRAGTLSVPTEYDAEEFGSAIQGFKAIFQGGSAPKGSVLLMCRDSDGALDVLFHAKPNKDGSKDTMEKLGTVSDERIARLIWLGYLAGDKVSSDATRRGVVEGCVGFAGRPVGSAETMVS